MELMAIIVQILTKNTVKEIVRNLTMKNIKIKGKESHAVRKKKNYFTDYVGFALILQGKYP